MDTLELERIEAQLSEYLRQLKRGEFWGARETAQSLVSATYVLDKDWMAGREWADKWTR